MTIRVHKRAIFIPVAFWSQYVHRSFAEYGHLLIRLVSSEDVVDYEVKNGEDQLLVRRLVRGQGHDQVEERPVV